MANRTPWTTKEEDFVRANYGKMPTKEIAKALGRKPMMVNSKANELGCYIKGKRKPNMLHALKSLYQSGGVEL